MKVTVAPPKSAISKRTNVCFDDMCATICALGVGKTLDFQPDMNSFIELALGTPLTNPKKELPLKKHQDSLGTVPLDLCTLLGVVPCHDFYLLRISKEVNPREEMGTFVSMFSSRSFVQKASVPQMAIASEKSPQRVSFAATVHFQDADHTL